MLLESSGFSIGNYEIPTFTLQDGEMIRFWVQLTPNSKEDIANFWDIEKMQTFCRKINKEHNIQMKMSPKQVKRGFFDLFKPLSAKAYLTKKSQLSTDEINEKLAFFEIKEWYKVKNLGFGHQKVFSIIHEFQQQELIIYDYYGLAPNGTKRLTKYVKTELQKGKSAISFDNLYYKPKDLDSERIINLEIHRRQ